MLYSCERPWEFCIFHDIRSPNNFSTIQRTVLFSHFYFFKWVRRLFYKWCNLQPGFFQYILKLLTWWNLFQTVGVEDIRMHVGNRDRFVRYFPNPCFYPFFLPSKRWGGMCRYISLSDWWIGKTMVVWLYKVFLWFFLHQWTALPIRMDKEN